MPNSLSLYILSRLTPSGLNLMASSTPHARSPARTRSISAVSQNGSTYTQITCDWEASVRAPLTLAECPSLPSQSASTILSHISFTSVAGAKIIHFPLPYLCSLRMRVSDSVDLGMHCSQASASLVLSGSPSEPTVFT